MHTFVKMAIVVGLMTAIGTVVILKNGGSCSTCPPGAAALNPSAFGRPAAVPTYDNTSGLPRLVELGSTTCIPCQMMKPVLEELTAEYAGRLDVVFIDVNRQPDKAARYRIRVMPTQVFLDTAGKELFRHEGFFAKEDILTQWKTLGYDFSDTPDSDIE